MNYQLFSAFVGVSFFITTLLLVRRDTLLPSSAIKWIVLSLSILVLSLFPSLSDKVALWVGVSYPPIVPVLLAIVILLVKVLTLDIQRTKDRVRLERLMQRVAMLENEIRKK